VVIRRKQMNRVNRIGHLHQHLAIRDCLECQLGRAVVRSAIGLHQYATVRRETCRQSVGRIADHFGDRGGVVVAENAEDDVRRANRLRLLLANLRTGFHFGHWSTFGESTPDSQVRSCTWRTRTGGRTGRAGRLQGFDVTARSRGRWARRIRPFLHGGCAGGRLRCRWRQPVGSCRIPWPSR